MRRDYVLSWRMLYRLVIENNSACNAWIEEAVFSKSVYFTTYSQIKASREVGKDLSARHIDGPATVEAFVRRYFAPSSVIDLNTINWRDYSVLRDRLGHDDFEIFTIANVMQSGFCYLCAEEREILFAKQLAPQIDCLIFGSLLNEP